MAPFELADRTERLFGRAGDAERLCTRVRHTGLTAIVGRPMMGKSWLLEEVARQLAADIAPYHLVGFSRSYGNPDSLLRAVSDLYQRWLADDRGWQTVRMAWTQQKDRLLPAFVGFLGKLAKDFPGLPKPAGAAIDEALKGLVAVRDALQSGGLSLPPLPYDQARELLASVATISGRPLVLLMDQWEAAPNPTAEALPLRQFLRDAEAWPTCHIILATSTQNAPAVAAARKLAQTYPGYAGISELTEMALDAPEQRRLGDFVRGRLPAVWDMTDAGLAAMIEGYPGVLYRWTSGDTVERMRGREDLAAAAREAQDLSFPELKELLDALEGERLRAAVRIALLPMLQDRSAWTALRQHVLASLPPDVLDRLRQASVLQSVNPPGFGHAKRAEAALRRLQGWNGATVASEAECLILALAGSIRRIDETALFPASALHALLKVAVASELGALPRAICESAATMFGERLGSSPRLFADARDATLLDPGVLFVLATGLLNTLNHAKAEGDLRRRDALLDELRALAAAHADAASVREQLAKGLYDTLNHAKAEDDLRRRDALLDELRALAAAHAEDAAVREQLAMGLFNTLNDAKAADDLRRRDALLDKLRALAAAHAEDAAVREQLAMGLFNTLVDAKAEDDLRRREALLDEVRALAAAHPDDAAMREPLAMGLFNTLVDAKAEDDLRRRDALLDELRALAATHAEDAAVPERLARGLFNTLNDAKAADDLRRRDALLDELRALTAAHADDAAVREWLARGLFNTLNHAKAEDDLRRRDALLEELRLLVARYPAEPIFGEIAQFLDELSGDQGSQR